MKSLFTGLVILLSGVISIGLAVLIFLLITVALI